MTRVTRLQLALLAASQSMALSFLPSMALALSASEIKAGPELAKLASYEEVIYGAVKRDKPTEARLADLEVKLFGKPSTGTAEARLSKISQTLSYGTGGAADGNKLLPPLPPKLDHLPVTRANDRTGSAPSGSSGGTYGSYEQAYENENGSTDGDTSDGDALASATSLYSAGRVAEAEQAFRAIADKNSRNADAFYNLGVIAEARGDLRSALYDYRRAAAINPDDRELAQTVSAVEAKVRQSSGGVLNPTVGASSVGTSSPGSVSPFRSGSPQAYSNSYSSSAFAKAPLPAPAYGSAAVAGANTPKLKKLVVDASSDYKRGNFDGAIAKLNQVAAVRSDDADVQYALAQAYRGKGQIGEARQCMARASALNPNNATYKIALSDLETALMNENGSLPTAPPRGAQVNASGMGGQLVSSSPQGAIKPFSDSKAGDSYASGNSFASGVSRSTSRRIERAISYGIAGAATGAISSAIWGSRYGGNRASRIGTGALRGAAVGAALGLLFGR